MQRIQPIQPMQRIQAVARFYDNDEQNFEGLPFIHLNLFDGIPLSIECIKVDDTTLHPLVEKDAKRVYQRIDGRTLLPPSLHQLRTMYIYNYFKNKIKKGITHVDKKLLQTLSDHDFLPSKGITDEQIMDLKRWCWKHRRVPKVVFFDWDKTLSVTDGFNTLHNASPDLVCAQTEYILGGKQRMKKLTEMMEFLEKHHVHIYILTNNTSLLHKKDIPVFTAIVRCIYPSFNPDIQFISPPRKHLTKRQSLESQEWYKKPLSFHWSDQLKGKK